MIKSFGDDDTKSVWEGRRPKKIPSDIISRAFRKLEYLDNANDISDLGVPPSNHLEALIGNLKGFWSIRINEKYRIVFKFEGSNAYDVEISNHYK